MKRGLSLLLLLGALLGLLGQEVAFAHVLPVQETGQTVATAPMSADCAKMMELAKQQSETDKPCKGMTPDCIAKMGCAVPLALLPIPLSGASPVLRAAVPRRALVSPLVGHNIGPEPEPPARLG